MGDKLATFLTDNGVVLGLVLAAIPIFVGFIIGISKFAQYVNVQRKKQKQVEYKNYHELIERLTAPLSGAQNAWLDVQKAAAFELRNYPQYAEVTEIILIGWINRGTEMDAIMKSTLKELNRPYNQQVKKK